MTTRINYQMANWQHTHVQPSNEINETKFLQAASTIISAGPPRLEHLSAVSGTNNSLLEAAAPDPGANTGDVVGASTPTAAPNAPAGAASANANISAQGTPTAVFPMGLTQSINITSSNPHQQLNEIGSDRPYFISTRHSGQVNLTRVMLHGPNLLRCLYAYAPDELLVGVDAGTEGFETISKTYTLGGGYNFPEGKVKDAPGHNGFWANMASRLFMLPFGLLVTLIDNSGSVYANFYIEQCRADTWQMGTAAAQNVMMETMQISFDRIQVVHGITKS